jgi:ubiquinone/menaquinone biosynthesis C-methylase UbiE
MVKSNLVNEQYKDSSNINVRIQLHELFSTNKQGFHEWVFDQMELKDGLRILECGCGPAALWYKNVEKIPSNISITLMDLSQGMLDDSKKNLQGIEDKFTFVCGNIQNIPFESDSFDIVIANHMLYHVPDKFKAIEEIYRVLKKGGKFFASTFGKGHLKEIDELTREFVELPSSRTSDSFTLENGLDYISTKFTGTKLLKHVDSLLINEPQPLVNYILSSSKVRNAFNAQGEDVLEQFKSKVNHMIAKDTPLEVTKDAGVFISVKEL